MTIVWSPQAEADRLAIFRHTASESVFAADALDVMFEEGAELLADDPDAGAPGAVPGTGELALHPSYTMIFVRARGEVRILALVDVRRQWSPHGGVRGQGE